MQDDEDWIMRPVLEGLIPYTALLDCSVDLEDIARMNEALEVRAENDYRVRKAMESNK